jgi:RNA polymerase sigma factor (sigma-70 family)
MAEGDSVTIWIRQLKIGDADAAQQLWNRYFERLVRLAQRRLVGAPCQMADEEDVALSAFNSVCIRAAEGKFPKLDDRQDLWRLLVTITVRKALAQRKYANRQKRRPGEGNQFRSDDDDTDAIQQVMGTEPSPELAAQMAEDCRLLMEQLDDPQLRTIAQRKLEGYTNEEIAAQLGTVARTVERKLQRIRMLWAATVDEEPA